MRGRVFCFLWFIGFGLALAAAEPLNALALQQRLIQIFDQNSDAVVQVKAAYAEPGVTEDGRREVTLRVGTGFFISREGHVLVSASRAAGAERVWIEHRGQNYAAEAVGHDRLTNISVLRTLELPEAFSIITIDTNVGHPRVGALAVAIACPLDFEPSPSLGIFTGIDRRIGDQFFPTEYLRTSISVDAGQGGCPVLDINGRFIGMSVASIPELGGSYCIPADALARVRDDLMFSGKVVHSWLGFEVRARLNGENRNEVLLSRVVEEAPAAIAGILEGDRLLAIGGRPIKDISDVPNAVFFTRVNQFTTIEVERDGRLMEFSVKALPRPEVSIAVEAEAADPEPSGEPADAAPAP